MQDFFLRGGFARRDACNFVWWQSPGDGLGVLFFSELFQFDLAVACLNPFLFYSHHASSLSSPWWWLSLLDRQNESRMILLGFLPSSLYLAIILMLSSLKHLAPAGKLGGGVALQDNIGTERSREALIARLLSLSWQEQKLPLGRLLVSKTHSTQTSPTWWSCLPLQQHDFCGRTHPTPGSLCGRIWPRPPMKGLVLNKKLTRNLFIFTSLSVNDNNHSPIISHCSQNGIHFCWWAAIIYELTNNIKKSNSVLCR